MCFHGAAPKAFIKKSDAKSNVNAHPLFVDLASRAILNENIRRVSS
jgi:hypothetical protein